MLILQNISYIHASKDLLFSDVSLVLNKKEKTALIGNNGVGKSTLLQIVSGNLRPTLGRVVTNTRPYYVPQVFSQFDHLSIVEALGIGAKFTALNEILKGNPAVKNFNILDEDWTVEERCREALRYWKLDHLELEQKMGTLSGGQKTKLFLAGIAIHQAEFILLDEPSNHLDVDARALLYNFVQTTSATLLVVSHDRKLLNLLDNVCELKTDGITVYGGNYDFCAEQKDIALNALNQNLKSKEKLLRNAKEKEKEAAERQNKLDTRGKKKQEKAGVARIMMNTLRNSAENSTSKLKGIHIEKMGSIAKQITDLRSALPAIDQMKFVFEMSDVNKGKRLFTASSINFSYQNTPLWRNNLSIQLDSGERILVKGANGSGKTTLIKIILGKLAPQKGFVQIHYRRTIYIDQDYALIDNTLNVYEQAQHFNQSGLEEHEVKIRLSRFLFGKETWSKPCHGLSGGEKMRLMLCCLTISRQPPDIILLDEPTNNLDIQNIEVMTAAIQRFKGTLIVVSHDEHFLEQINIERVIDLAQL